MAMKAARLIDPFGSRDGIATALLGMRGMDDVERLAAHSGGGQPRESVLVGGVVLTQERFDALRSRAEEVVTEYQGQHQLRPGIPLATLAGTLGVSNELAERLVEDSKDLGRSGPDVSTQQHRLGLDPDAELRWEKARARLGESLAVPDADDLGLGRELTHLMIREARLIRVSDDLVYLPDQVEEIARMLGEMTEPFTVAQFRDHSGLSRKYVVPILEWADREGLTIRRGDLRHLR